MPRLRRLEPEEAAKKAKEEELVSAAGGNRAEEVQRLLEEGVSAEAKDGDRTVVNNPDQENVQSTGPSWNGKAFHSFFKQALKDQTKRITRLDLQPLEQPSSAFLEAASFLVAQTGIESANVELDQLSDEHILLLFDS